jgi:mono/diheme cytochrome c family protein
VRAVRGSICSLLLLTSCFPNQFIEPDVGEQGEQPSASRGKKVLLNRSYLKVGVPVTLVDALMTPVFDPEDDVPLLEDREGINASVPNGYSGRWLKEVPIVAENCLLCHAGPLRGQWVMGLGNSFLDATIAPEVSLVDEEKLKELAPTEDELKVLGDWLRYQKDLAPYARAKSWGTVAALYFTGYFFSHRRAEDFVWVEQPFFAMLTTPPPETDIPAWWLLKKKSRLYYGGELEGDFTRSLMQFMSPPGNSAEDLVAAEKDFADVLAYLKTIEAPRYPGKIDKKLARTGEALFEDSCSGCHGEYGKNPSYPSKVVPLAKVGTDPARNDFMHRMNFAEHYNRTWFGKRSTMAATEGYIAPPLDGVWATAPYLHNGSVPTLEAVLDPALRPSCFLRARDSRRYDLERVGWEHETPKDCSGVAVFDTSLYGKGNGGHEFGLRLDPAERRAVLEYLKTL